MTKYFFLFRGILGSKNFSLPIFKIFHRDKIFFPSYNLKKSIGTFFKKYENQQLFFFNS